LDRKHWRGVAECGPARLDLPPSDSHSGRRENGIRRSIYGKRGKINGKRRKIKGDRGESFCTVK